MKTSEIVDKIKLLLYEIDCDDLVELHNYLFPTESIKIEDITDVDE